MNRKYLGTLQLAGLVVYALLLRAMYWVGAADLEQQVKVLVIICIIALGACSISLCAFAKWDDKAPWSTPERQMRKGLGLAFFGGAVGAIYFLAAGIAKYASLYDHAMSPWLVAPALAALLVAIGIGLMQASIPRSESASANNLRHLNRQ